MISLKSRQIYEQARRSGFGDKQAKILVSQAAHETKGFVSCIFISNNNAFGMKYAGQSLAKGEKKGYAFYDSIEDSVKDIAKWISKKVTFINLFSPLRSIEEYVGFLKVYKYFEDTETNYLKGCKYWHKKIYNE